MEEAWEFAAVSEGSTLTFDGFSGRQVRLKYQAFLACLTAALVSFGGIKSFNFLGGLELIEIPNLLTVEIFLILFALFSLISFISHTKLEQYRMPETYNVLSGFYERASESLLPELKRIIGECESVLTPKIVEFYSTQENQNRGRKNLDDEHSEFKPFFLPFKTVADSLQISKQYFEDLTIEGQLSIYPNGSNKFLMLRNTMDYLTKDVVTISAMYFRDKKHDESQRFHEVKDVDALKSLLKQTKAMSLYLLKQLDRRTKGLSVRRKNYKWVTSGLSVLIPFIGSAVLLLSAVIGSLIYIVFERRVFEFL